MEIVLSTISVFLTIVNIRYNTIELLSFLWLELATLLRNTRFFQISFPRFVEHSCKILRLIFLNSRFLSPLKKIDISSSLGFNQISLHLYFVNFQISTGAVAICYPMKNLSNINSILSTSEFLLQYIVRLSSVSSIISYSTKRFQFQVIEIPSISRYFFQISFSK